MAKNARLSIARGYEMMLTQRHQPNEVKRGQISFLPCDVLTRMPSNKRQQTFTTGITTNGINARNIYMLHYA